MTATITARRFTAHALALLLILVTSVISSFAGEVRGQVTLSGRPAKDVVISIQGLRVATPPDGAEYVLDHRGLLFAPHVMVIPIGAVVHFKNSDGMPCRIYSTSEAGLFVLRLKKGEPQPVRFDRPGVIEVHCAEHGHLLAYIVVKENPYFAITDSKGEYSISGLPPGQYEVQAWHEGTVLVNRSVRVEVQQDKVRIDFHVVRPLVEQKAESQSANLLLQTKPSPCLAGTVCDGNATTGRSPE